MPLSSGVTQHPGFTARGRPGAAGTSAGEDAGGLGLGSKTVKMVC